MTAAEHMGISNLTGKCVKNVKVSDQLLQCDCKIDFDHFDILASDTNSFRLLKEVFSSHLTNFVHCLVLKIPLTRKFVLTLFIAIRVAAGMLLIIVKPTDTFLQELQNLCVFQI